MRCRHRSGAQRGTAAGRVGRGCQGCPRQVVTDVLTADIDANGGDIRELVFTNYRENENENAPFRLFEEKPGAITSRRAA